jgi:hypothetical protein
VVPFARKLYGFYLVIMTTSFILPLCQYIQNPHHCTLIAAQVEFFGTSWYLPLVVAQQVATAYVLLCQTFFECNVIIISHHLSNYFAILKDCVKYRLGVWDADVNKYIRADEAQKILNNEKKILCANNKATGCARGDDVSFLAVWQKYENFGHLVERFNKIFGPVSDI